MQFGFCTPSEADRLRRSTPSGTLAAGLREVREWAYAAVYKGDRSAAAELQRLHQAWQGRASIAPPEGTGPAWTLTDVDLDAETLRLRIARAAVELLVSPDGAGVSQCADDQCGWVYLDTSPRRNRKWCVAEECGARNRSRRHYENTRGRRTATTA